MIITYGAPRRAQDGPVIPTARGMRESDSTLALGRAIELEPPLPAHRMEYPVEWERSPGPVSRGDRRNRRRPPVDAL